MSTSSDSAADFSDSFGQVIGELLGRPADAGPLTVGREPPESFLDAGGQRLVYLAAQRVHEDGAPAMDSAHLLWGAAKVDPSRGLISQVSVDPDMLAHQITRVLPKTTGAAPDRPVLTPAAKRVLASAYARAQDAGSAQIGPEHVLGALLDQDEPGSQIAIMLRADNVDVERLRALTDRSVR